MCVCGLVRAGGLKKEEKKKRRRGLIGDEGSVTSQQEDVKIR